ncbi:MAG: hypothetical protein HQL66_00745 [Magnetococcales bacterium]|nr:hypothetical protein [Magnetococcales bacterium]
MAVVSAVLPLSIASRAASEPFELVVDDDQGGAFPCIVAFTVEAGTIAVWEDGKPPPATSEDSLRVERPGIKRIKLFCSDEVANTVRLSVDGNSFGWGYDYLGRRQDVIKEDITWRREVRKTLRYPYNVTSVSIDQRTDFWDDRDNMVPTPVFDRDRGEFYSPVACTGAMFVSYTVPFSLYSIPYDNGKKVASADVFKAMQRAWEKGDVTLAEVPPVRVFGKSKYHAGSLSFPRLFWPRGRPEIRIRKPRDGADNNGDDVKDEDLLIQMPGKKKTDTKPVTNPDDTSQKVDVKRTTEVWMKDQDTGRVIKMRFLPDDESSNS